MTPSSAPLPQPRTMTEDAATVDQPIAQLRADAAALRADAAAFAVAPVRVGDLMSQPVLTVEVAESLWDAWQLLFVSGLRHLVVLDEGGSCVGVLSDRAVLSDLPMTPEHMGRRRVGDVLARVPLIHLSPDQSPTDAARLMTRHSIEAIPVIDDEERLVGVVTGSDLVRWLAE